MVPYHEIKSNRGLVAGSKPNLNSGSLNQVLTKIETRNTKCVVYCITLRD